MIFKDFLLSSSDLDKQRVAKGRDDWSDRMQENVQTIHYSELKAASQQISRGPNIILILLLFLFL